MVPAVRGNVFFAKYWWPVQWVPTVRWRNNYFHHNKEALPCDCRGPSCQPLHIQYSSDGSRSLTTLTTSRREHQGGGRRRGLGRGRLGDGEDATVDAHAKRSTSVHRFARHARCAALLRCQRRQQPTSIGRVLYVERLTVGSTIATRKCLLLRGK